MDPGSRFAWPGVTGFYELFQRQFLPPLNFPGFTLFVPHEFIHQGSRGARA
jgi:hypothetical protein